MTSRYSESLDMNGFVAIIKRTRRRGSIGFRITLGQLVVLVPKHIPVLELREILESKRQLILSKLKALNLLASEEYHVAATKRCYVSGERLTYLDSELLLRVCEGRFYTKLTGAHEIEVSVPAANSDWVRNALVRWYKLQAQQYMEQRINYFAPIVGAWPKAIEIKTYSARWGSCTSAGVVQFNWKLMMAPAPVLDSVVVHELCHLLYMHHGPEFWEQVERVLPAYRDARQWLKDEGHLLGLD